MGEPRIRVYGGGGGSASSVAITDTEDFYTGTTVEEALNEVGESLSELAGLNALLSDEVQTITLSGGAENDTFKLTYNAHESSAAVTIPAGGYASTTAAAIRVALITVSDFASPAVEAADIVVTGGPGAAIVTFGGKYSGLDMGAITITSKTGTADGSVAETTKGGVPSTHAALTTGVHGVGTGTVLGLGSSTVAGSTPVGGYIIARRAADSSAKTNDTLANDTTLLWAVAANEVWFFDIWATWSGAKTTHDLKVGWSVPASAAMSWGPVSGTFQWTPQAAASSPVAILGAAGTAALGGISGTLGPVISGIVVVSSTAGNMNLQWAQNTTDAGELKMLANSFLRATRLA